MKKYRLKEEVKKYVSIGVNNLRELGFWETIGFTLEALEEVEQRAELWYTNISINNKDMQTAVYRADGGSIKHEDVMIMQKAINGELLDVDFIMDFMEYYDSKYIGMDRNHFKEILKQYLKEMK